MIIEKLRTSLLRKILLCASIKIVNWPFSTNFDGDFIHIYYLQSLAAKVEALVLFSVEKQLISSHSDTVNLYCSHVIPCIWITFLPFFFLAMLIYTRSV